MNLEIVKNQTQLSSPEIDPAASLSPRTSFLKQLYASYFIAIGKERNNNNRTTTIQLMTYFLAFYEDNVVRSMLYLTYSSSK
jgi:hypothetical protein